MLVNFIQNRSAVIVFLLIGFFSPATALASTYGSGSYNSCNYNGVGCTSSSTSASSSGIAGSGDVIDLDLFSAFGDGTGKSTEISSGTVFEFDLFVESGVSKDSESTSTATERHTITINSITSDSVVITVASTPKQYTLRLLQPLLLDLTGDGVNDIGIEATTITPPTATLKVWKIAAAGAGVATPTAAGTTSGDNSRIITYGLIVGSIILLLVLPRRIFEKIMSVFTKHDHHGKHNGPFNLGLPANDFHSQAGDVINEDLPKDPVDEDKK